MQDGELWVNELLYETRLTNPDIANRLKAAGVSRNAEIIADSAEPKSIEELRRLGWYITPARKGPDSVKVSIDILKRYRIHVTRSSINLRRELERYQWKVGSANRTVNEPVDTWNHLIDPLRYIALNKLQTPSTAKPSSKLPWKSGMQVNSEITGFL